MVKANAYGHRIMEVSRAAEEEGVTWLGVSRIEEAISLRNAGIRCSIFNPGIYLSTQDTGGDRERCDRDAL